MPCERRLALLRFNLPPTRGPAQQAGVLHLEAVVLDVPEAARFGDGPGLGVGDAELEPEGAGAGGDRLAGHVGGVLRAAEDVDQVPEPIDLVDVFRRPEHTPDVARAAVAAGVGALWLQLGISNPEARTIAEEAGLRYVEDRCLKVEHGRLLGRSRAGS